MAHRKDDIQSNPLPKIKFAGGGATSNMYINKDRLGVKTISKMLPSPLQIDACLNLPLLARLKLSRLSL